MSRLFASVYLDEDVDVLVAVLLRGHGFDARTSHEAGMDGVEDAEQLALAVREGRVLLSHNRGDFEALAAQYHESDRSHSGIVLAFRRPPREIVKNLLVVLNGLTADELENQLLFV